jgi:hypothetical protein
MMGARFFVIENNRALTAKAMGHPSSFAGYREKSKMLLGAGSVAAGCGAVAMDA